MRARRAIGDCFELPGTVSIAPPSCRLIDMIPAATDALNVARSRQRFVHSMHWGVSRRDQSMRLKLRP